MSSQSNSQPAAEAINNRVRATWIVSLFTMVSRILGYARLIILVRMFVDIRWASDAFLFAFRIPNLFRNLLGEGALNASFIPVFVKTREQEGNKSASELASSVFSLLAVLTAGITVVGVLVFFVLGWYFQARNEVALAMNLTAIMFPFMAGICLAAMLSGILQGVRRFTLPAAMSIVLNIAFLSAFAYIYWWQCGGDLSRLEATRSTYALAYAVLAAGLLEVILQWPAVLAAGIRLRPVFSRSHPGVTETLKAFGPTALGLGVVQINSLVDGLIAGALALYSQGAVTYLEIGNRFMLLPMGVFGVAIATTAFPDLASFAARKDNAALLKRTVAALRMALFLILPASAGLIAMADPIVRLTCQRPDLAFSHTAVYRSALVMILYSAGLIFYTTQQILVRVYYARREYTYPVKISAYMVGLNLVLNLALINMPDLFRARFPSYLAYWNISPNDFPLGLKMGEAGLALATCITAMVNVIFLGVGLRKRLKPTISKVIWEEQTTLLGNSAARLFLTAAATGVLTYLYRSSIPYEPEFWQLFIRVAIPCVLAVGTYYIVGMILSIPELDEYLGGKKKKTDKTS